LLELIPDRLLLGTRCGLAAYVVALVRARAAAEPTGRPVLASALGNESLALRGVGGREEEVLASIQEAVRIYRRIAEENPRRWQSVYRQRLSLLRRLLEEQGLNEESLREGLRDLGPMPVGVM
jgi:hypothetical protein